MPGKVSLTYHILGEEVDPQKLQGIKISLNSTVGILRHKLLAEHPSLGPFPRLYNHFIPIYRFPQLEAELEQFKVEITAPDFEPLNPVYPLSTAFAAKPKDGIHFIVAPRADVHTSVEGEVKKLKSALQISLNHTKHLLCRQRRDSTTEGLSALTSTPAISPRNASERVAFNIISILKEELGKTFVEHFEEVEAYMMNSKELRILGSYVAVLLRHRGKESGFTRKCSVLAKEVSLAAILVDPAIDYIRPGCGRDQKTLTAGVDYRHTVVKLEPSDDFCVAYGNESARYALLNGETGSSSEDEEEAMHKMSVVSKYSHGIIQQLINEDTVILDSSEVDVIEYLQSVKHSRYRNGVIRVADILRYETLRASVIMPRYKPFQSLSWMSPKEYHNLRLQVVEAVAFLHAERVTHRDLKPANIVVNLINQELCAARIYIIDFGNARRCTPGYRCKGFRGTRGWTAPEVRDGATWEPLSADVWAMAKTLLHLAALACTPDEVMSKVVAYREPSKRPARSIHHSLGPLNAPTFLRNSLMSSLRQ
ncbi:hypothetical protein FRB94_008430 [Tulasnella sp. JGI-2019a]|nr:hypothetical protein FRB94_008430 [Tulasnella sp. JGI-2019a]